MKQFVLFGIMMGVLFLGGCAASLPPHEAVNQAFRKSFDASGYNFASRTQVTDISVPKSGELGRTQPMALGAGLSLLRGLSIGVDGALDMKGKKSEVLYDLHYERDNVAVSIKIPLMMDYSTQTVYVGGSIITTILEATYPQAPATRGKLIRINLEELLREGAESSPELSKLLGENRFSPKNIDLWNNAIKDGVLKTLAGLNDGYFREVPLVEQDRAVGAARRIQITLGHKDSINVVLDLISTVSQELFRAGVIGEEEYSLFKSLSDRQQLEGVTDKFNLAMILEVGIDSDDFVRLVDSRLNVSDAEAQYRLGVRNVTEMSNYNAPRFSMKPESAEVVDFKELMEVILADTAKRLSDAQSESEECEDDETDDPAPLSKS